MRETTTTVRERGLCRAVFHEIRNPKKKVSTCYTNSHSQQTSSIYTNFIHNVGVYTSGHHNNPLTVGLSMKWRENADRQLGSAPPRPAVIHVGDYYNGGEQFMMCTV